MTLQAHQVVAKTLKIHLDGMRDKIPLAAQDEDWDRAFELLDIMIEAMPEDKWLHGEHLKRKG